ncbi:DMT family transporter [Algihabitans albus]|uniref:DMT family transporter n=1 Tax=Algihabitans albus TaxID=2164067 RepID=UPI0013C2C309|nr:DMT family transporter [Algihabitans albus]
MLLRTGLFPTALDDDPVKLADYPRFAYLAVLVGVVGHASSEFFAVLSGVFGPEVSVWRYLLGGAGLIVLSLSMPGSRDLITPLKEEGLRLVLLAMIGVSGAYLFFHWALDYATVVQVGTLITTMPIFIALINLWVNRQPIGAPKALSAGFAVLGIALLLTDGYLMQLAGSGQQLVGLGMTLLCGFLGAGYAVLAKPLMNRYGAIRITTITMSLGGAGLWIIVGAAWGIWVDPSRLFDLDPVASASLLTLALFNTTLTQVLFFGGLAAVPDITRGSYLFFLKPVFAALLAYLFLSQPITALQLVAIAVVVSSVAAEALWARRLKTRSLAEEKHG